MNLFESFDALSELVDKHRAVTYIVAVIVVGLICWTILSIWG